MVDNTLALAQARDYFDLVALSVTFLRGSGGEDHANRLVECVARLRDRVRDHPWLDVLGQQLGLSQTETMAVWTLAASACRPDVRDALAELGELTLDTLRAIVFGAAPSTRSFVELSDAGALRALSIIERSDGSDDAVHESQWTWTISRRVLALLHGDTHGDPELRSLLRSSGGLGGPVDDRLILEMSRGGSGGAFVVDQSGADCVTQVQLAARALGFDAVELDVSQLPDDMARANLQLRRVARECRLSGRAPVVGNADRVSPSILEAIGRELVPQTRGPVFACGRTVPRGVDWLMQLPTIDRRVAIAIPTPEPTSVERRLRRARAQIAAVGSSHPPAIEIPSCEPPIGWLQDRLGLSTSELDVLWLLVAHELCPIAREGLRRLNTEDSVDVSWDTVRRVVHGSAANPRTWTELSASAALFRLHLVERSDSGHVPIQRTTLRLVPRVLALIHGDVNLDPEISSLACLLDHPDPSVVLEVEEGIREDVACGIRSRQFVTVGGMSGSGRRTLLRHEAAKLDIDLIEIDCNGLSPEREPLQRQLEVIGRECQLHRRMPLFRHVDRLAGSGDTPDRLDLVERTFDGGILATCSALVSRRWKSQLRYVEVPSLTISARARVWSHALTDATEADARLLATMYPIAPALIGEVGAVARRQAAKQAMTPEHIAIGIRHVLDDRLGGLANRVVTTQTWDDVVLSDDQASSILELLARIRERERVYEQWGFGRKIGKRLGVSALFSGPPGTGKTMTAGLIARDLNLELYQVDLSKIVSKWIGETEKNLSTLFDAAESGHAVLLFDEADALFGKRTEVRSSNDRHANQEVNYLLQRLESFAGICILTTNHDNAIDEAFLRRLSLRVRFQMPEAEERLRLWEAMLPTSAPRESNLGLASLASKYPMSGGYIRNAMLRAAFFAVEDGETILARHVALAAQLEYEAMGSLVART